MPMHSDQWKTLSIEEKLDQLRLESVAAQCIISALLKALNIQLATGDDEPEES